MSKRPRLCKEEDGFGPQDQGRRFYLSKDYAAAAEAFTEAINSSNGHLLLKALDSRAATYEKLENLHLALKDGRTMIQTMPNVSKGYLRTGKVLCLKGEKSLALKIYERGLSKVKFGSDKDRTVGRHFLTYPSLAHNNIKILQSMLNKLQAELGTGKTRDPLQYLPIELAQMICEELGMRDRVICLAVSKSWKNFLESIHGLWTLFDTTNARGPITLNALKAHLRRSNYTLSRAIITLRSSMDKRKLTYLFETCKYLNDLKICGNGVIGETLMDSLPAAKNIERLYVSNVTQITLSVVQAALRLCQQTIVDVSFLNIKGSSSGAVTWPKLDALKSINLRNFSGTVDIDLNSLLLNTPNATKVILNDCVLIPPGTWDLTPWSKLELLDLTNSQLTRLPKLPRTLKHLALDNNPLLFLTFNEEIGPFHLPSLESFSCRTTFIEAKGLLEITRASIEAKNLKKLSIGDRLNAFTSTVPVSEEFPASSTVEELSIAYLHLRDDRTLDILDLYPNLKKIDLSGTYITGITVKALVERGVEWIKLNECHNISHDAIEMARSKGVYVGFQFPNKLSTRRFQNLSRWENGGSIF
ncbi:hypothetical protein K3495_g9094 [Podosphaera aphanis]|nr:hypothetical protein K3495_g9094 [Podosphaera aphanis]